jgi:hypothetical protein
MFGPWCFFQETLNLNLNLNLATICIVYFLRVSAPPRLALRSGGQVRQKK